MGSRADCCGSAPSGTSSRTSFYPWQMHLGDITHINYAFFDVTASCNVATIDSYADYELRQEAAGQTVYGNLAAFRALREQQAALGQLLPERRRLTANTPG